MADTYEVRIAARAEIDLALDWAAKEGWNPGLDDARAFHAADPFGFFVGWCDGAPAAAISAVAYGSSFVFVGLFIARPEYRGAKVGSAILRKALKRSPGALLGCDGVVERQANYARLGFRLAHRNIRYGGVAPVDVGRQPQHVAAASVPFDRIAAYDRLCFPAPRAAFLSLWTDPANGAALAAIADGRVRGLGVIRACRKGSKIGPLFADNEHIADNLFRALAARAKGGEIFLDTPEPNAAAVSLAQRYGMKPVFETARMYTGDAPDIDLARMFGVTTFELG